MLVDPGGYLWCWGKTSLNAFWWHGRRTERAQWLVVFYRAWNINVPSSKMWWRDCFCRPVITQLCNVISGWLCLRSQPQDICKDLLINQLGFNGSCHKGFHCPHGKKPGKWKIWVRIKDDQPLQPKKVGFQVVLSQWFLVQPLSNQPIPIPSMTPVYLLTNCSIKKIN